VCIPHRKWSACWSWIPYSVATNEATKSLHLVPKEFAACTSLFFLKTEIQLYGNLRWPSTLRWGFHLSFHSLRSLLSIQCYAHSPWFFIEKARTQDNDSQSPSKDIIKTWLFFLAGSSYGNKRMLLLWNTWHQIWVLTWTGEPCAIAYPSERISRWLTMHKDPSLQMS